MPENNNENLKQRLEELEIRNIKLETEVEYLSSRDPGFKNAAPSEGGDEVDLLELFRVVLKHKWIVLLFSFTFGVVAGGVSLLIPNEYRSTAILIPANQEDASLSKLAGQFGGLASIAGVDLGGLGSEDRSAVAIEIMKTWGFIDEFIREQKIEAEVYASTGWEKDTNRLIFDNSIYDASKSKWKESSGLKSGKSVKPSSWELFEEFEDKLNIKQDSTTNLVYLSIEHYSPYIAKEWVERYVESINNFLQEKDKSEALERVSYLENQIRNTNVAEMRNVFYQLIEEQTKTLMLTEVSDEYVFKVVSEPRIAEEEVKPKRVFILIIGFVLGALFAFALTLYRHYFKS